MTDEPTAAPHQAYYCEENIWHLAKRLTAPQLRSARVLIVTNATRSVALWHQQPAKSGETPVAWDYHVLLATRGPGPSWQIWDPASTLSTPLAASDYIDQTFAHSEGWPPEFLPVFRVVEAERYLQDFDSDRSHMRTDEGWRRPPPDWPPIRGGSLTLEQLLDLGDEAPGRWLDRSDLLVSLEGDR
jgi:hypothetical protein